MTGRFGRGEPTSAGDTESRVTPGSSRVGSAAGRQFAWVALGRVIAATAQAVLMVLLIRSTAPEQFAVVGTVYGALTFAQGAGGLGLPVLIVRERSSGANPAIVVTALWLADRVAACLTVVLALTATVLGFLVNPTFLPLIPLAVWAAAEFNADTWMGVALADGRGHLVTANLVGRRLLNLGLFLGLQLVSTPVLTAFGISSAASALASVVTTHCLMVGRVRARPAASVRSVLKISRSYWITSMATLARNLDAALVHTVTTATQASFYAAAARLSGPMRLLPQSLSSVLLPLTAKSKGGVGKVLNVVGLAVSLMLVVYGGAAALVPVVAPLLLGANYGGAVRALQVTCVGLVFAAAASMLSAILQGTGHTTYVSRVALATTAVFLIGVLIGGHLADAVGAAAGVGFSYLMQAVVLYIRIRRLPGVTTDDELGAT